MSVCRIEPLHQSAAQQPPLTLSSHFLASLLPPFFLPSTPHYWGRRSVLHLLGQALPAPRGARQRCGCGDVPGSCCGRCRDAVGGDSARHQLRECASRLEQSCKRRCISVIVPCGRLLSAALHGYPSVPQIRRWTTLRRARRRSGRWSPPITLWSLPSNSCRCGRIAYLLRFPEGR